MNGYYEIRMINNDLFKTYEAPKQWQDVEGPGRTFCGWKTFKDTRSMGQVGVMVNMDLVASIRYVGNPEDTAVGQIVDAEFIDNVAQASMQILSGILGSPKRNDEVIIVDDKDKGDE